MVVALPCVAQFVIVLDVTIVAIALPAIQADLGFSTTGLGWVITAYTLVFGGCLLAAGRLADRIGRRRTFVAGLSLFAVASLACGLAPSGALLLAARAVQGVGAALVSPAALALVTSARPQGKERARALGWWTAAAAGGGASGWVLGGVLSGLFDWRWVFLVNVPLCATAAALAPRVLAEARDPAARPREARSVAPATVARRDDAAGSAPATGLAALVLGFTLSERHGPLAIPPLIAFAAAIALLVTFARVERRVPHPLLDRERISRPGVLGPNVVALVLTATTSPAILMCTLHAQQILGLEPAAAGLLFAPVNLAVIAGSLLGPRIVARAGTQATMTGGLLAIAAGALALHAIAPDAPAITSMLGGFVVLGLGLGAASVASTARGTAALEGADQGLASALLATSAQLGTAFGLAIVLPIATARTHALHDSEAAHVAGYELGFDLVAALAVATAVLVIVRSRTATPAR
jgi:MFS family permease